MLSTTYTADKSGTRQFNCSCSNMEGGSMKHSCRILLVLSSLLYLTVGVASADTLIPFTLCPNTCVTGGPVTASFKLPAGQLLPESSDPGVVFTITPVDLMIDGAPSTDFLAFYNSTFLGGFAAFFSGSSFDFNLIGPQLFTGSEDSPTISTGSFPLLDFDGGKFNLVVGTVATPEPSTIVLLSFGVLAMGLATIGFKRRFAISAS